MELLRIAATILLVLLLGAASWTLTHWRRIKKELIANDLMPQATPSHNFLLFLSVAFIALSGLLIGFLLH